MNRKNLEQYILSLPNTKLEFPFGEDVAVYKTFVPDKAKTSHAGINNNKESNSSRNDVYTQDAHGTWKMYALMPENQEPLRLSLKCAPDLSVTLRERYESVMEGYHLNKKHWITALITGQLTEDEIHALILHSYNLVSGYNRDTPDFN